MSKENSLHPGLTHAIPLHPGQTHAAPLYTQLPLEEYEALMKENKALKQANANMAESIAELDAMRLKEVELDMRERELKERHRWRKFSEEKPEHHQWILVFYPNHSQFTTGVELRRWDNGCKYDVEVQEIYEKWMPLPSAPEEAANEQQ